MYKIVFYKNARGEAPVGAWLKELYDTKNTAVLNKVYRYMNLLQEKGTWIGMPFVRDMKIKKIPGKIWELRPGDYRIFFTCYCGNEFVLLHHYLKQDDRAPERQIKQATAEYWDWKKRGGNENETV
ncbi:hypothetical protein AR437_13100 [Christensenella hongkongensis]|uniref:type II toxin-antitoxin system RelE/ParE family toxin n=1 Tax=Christensenella hongkongensis TaxID=270498 RepID=UPI00073FDF5A|nr:type II toxin-antitoxin system RelE/ParE family toxin [Christensenella hongkongensis]KUJ32994.1 hypothetical protein AR437_13100 [Christensenella hongkongensis]